MAEGRQPYRPSNGTEGMQFTDTYCAFCKNQNPTPDDGGPDCNILARSMACDFSDGIGDGDGQYPKEWVYVQEVPTCTAHRPWDWAKDGAPPEPPPVAPGQYTIFDMLNSDKNERNT